CASCVRQLLSPFFFSCSGDHRDLHSFPTRRSSDLAAHPDRRLCRQRNRSGGEAYVSPLEAREAGAGEHGKAAGRPKLFNHGDRRSEEHTSELQSRENLVCRLLLEKKKKNNTPNVET